MQRIGWWGSLVACWLLAWPMAVDQAHADAPEGPGSLRSFLRFEPAQAGQGQLLTSLRTYARDDGVRVTLVSVVHVADQAYYEQLQEIMDGFDSLLYEMIRDTEAEPGARIDTSNPLSQLQVGMKSLLGLAFQLEVIRYDRPHFVHADLDPETFFRLQSERGESLLGLMFRAMLEEQRRQAAHPQAALSGFQLMMALLSSDRAHSLKLLLGQQMDQMESLLAGIDESQDGHGSVLVSGRNAHAIRVLEKQLQKGRRNLGIFYGAGHMPDLERRLESMGFNRESERWLVAWDIRRERSASGSAEAE
jgi:hypothetical protein